MSYIIFQLKYSIWFIISHLLCLRSCYYLVVCLPLTLVPDNFFFEHSHVSGSGTGSSQQAHTMWLRVFFACKDRLLIKQFATWVVWYWSDLMLKWAQQRYWFNYLFDLVKSVSVEHSWFEDKPSAYLFQWGHSFSWWLVHTSICLQR